MTTAILQAGVVRVVPAMGAAPECWIRVVPGIDPESVRDLVAVGFPEVPVIIVPFAKAGDLSVDPATILEHGASRYLWVAGSVVALLLSMVVALASRSELGIYRAMGTSTSEIWFMQLVQVSMTVVLSAALGTVAGLLGASLALDLPLTLDAFWFVASPAIGLALTVAVLAPASHALVASLAIVDTLRGS